MICVVHLWYTEPPSFQGMCQGSIIGRPRKEGVNSPPSPLPETSRQLHKNYCESGPIECRMSQHVQHLSFQTTSGPSWSWLANGSANLARIVSLGKKPLSRLVHFRWRL